jgi:hypothetical protein
MKTTIIYEGNVIYDLPQLEVGDFGQIFTFHIKTEVNGAYDLTDKIVDYIKNPEKYQNIINETKNKILKKLCIHEIEEQILSLPFFV